MKFIFKKFYKIDSDYIYNVIGVSKIEDRLFELGENDLGRLYKEVIFMLGFEE